MDIFSKKIQKSTRTHISENFPAPICTKIAAPAGVRARPHTKALPMDLQKGLEPIVIFCLVICCFSYNLLDYIMEPFQNMTCINSVNTVSTY